MDANQFALVKELFALVCDLPEPERRACLQARTDDAEVIDEVLALLGQGELRTARFAQPVFGALSAIANAPLKSGDVLGAWTLTAEIGRGGMGKVFRAERSDGHFEQVAAIKLLAGFASERALEYLARERQILASLSHPNIARLFDGGATADGQPYLVMEYVEGVPIDQYCRQNKLSRSAMLRLFMVVCAAVAFAHQRLVVHCDLKPSNILVTPEGRPILLDFGVSRLLNTVQDEGPEMPAATAGSHTLTGAAFTPRYASPEQKARGDVGTGSDVYSLGLMLAELLGVTLTTTALSITTLVALPGDLAAIILRASAATPVDRYVGVTALADDLQRFLDHQPVAARPQTMRYVVGRLLRRQWPLALAATVLLVTVAGFSWRTVIERDNALAAERATREVKDYIISVFQGADPEVSGQRDLLVSALLDTGRAELATRLKDQPKIHVEMLGILGGIYQKLGKREQAIKMFDEAMAIERIHHRPLVFTDLLYKKAYTLYDMEDYTRAEPVLIEVLKMRESVAPDSASLVEPLRFLGTTQIYMDKSASARPYLDRALLLSKRHFGDLSVETAQVHLDFGRYFAMQEDGWREGEQHARIALRLLEEKFGRNHHLTVDALEILGFQLMLAARYAESIPMMREMSEKRAKLYGEFSNKNIFGLYSYAAVLGRAGRRLEAAVLFERCIVIQEKLDGARSLAVVEPMFLLATLKERMGAYQAALDLATEGLRIHKKYNVTAHHGTYGAQHIAGQSLRQLGRVAEAERVTSGVLTELKGLTAGHPAYIARSTLELAAVYRTQKKYAEAEKLLASLDVNRPTKDREGGGRIVAESARLAQAQGKFVQALNLFAEAEAMFVNGYGDQHPDSWLSKIDRAELLYQLGRHDEARLLARNIAVNAKPAIDPKGHIARRLARLQA